MCAVTTVRDLPVRDDVVAAFAVAPIMLKAWRECRRFKIAIKAPATILEWQWMRFLATGTPPCKSMRGLTHLIRDLSHYVLLVSGFLSRWFIAFDAKIAKFDLGHTAVWMMKNDAFNTIVDSEPLLQSVEGARYVIFCD